MLLLLLNYVVLGALWKIDVHLISTLVNKSLLIREHSYFADTREYDIQLYPKLTKNAIKKLL